MASGSFRSLAPASIGCPEYGAARIVSYPLVPRVEYEAAARYSTTAAFRLWGWGIDANAMQLDRDGDGLCEAS